MKVAVAVALLLAPVGALANDADLVAAAEKAVAHDMKDPDSLKFRELHVASSFQVVEDTETKTLQLVCGEVNGKNTYGAYAGFQKFVVLTNSDGKSKVVFDKHKPEFGGFWTARCVGHDASPMIVHAAVQGQSTAQATPIQEQPARQAEAQYRFLATQDPTMQELCNQALVVKQLWQDAMNSEQYRKWQVLADPVRGTCNPGFADMHLSQRTAHGLFASKEHLTLLKDAFSGGDIQVLLH